MQAMILAAGFGTRLLPHTRRRPKPLFPVLNQPLLLLTIRRLQRAGCDPVIVNCHHLADQIIEAVSRIDGVIVVKEKSIMGTGGGLRHAVRFFRNEPVLVTNGDIYHTVNFSTLILSHRQSGAEVILAMHDEPRFNCVEVHGDRVVAFTDKTDSPHLLAFAGLHVVNRDLLAEIPDQCFFSIIDLYKQMLIQQRAIAVMRVDDHYWTDMGTPDDYLALHGKLLKKEVKLWREFGSIDDSTCFFADTGKEHSSLVVKDWVCVGNAHLGRGVILERAVIWDDAVISDNSIITDCIVSK